MKRISRRNFLKAMGISATALTLAGRVRRLFQFHRSRHSWLHCCQCSSNR